MSAHGYGPGLSDQGIGPDDAYIGDCAECGRSFDAGDERVGWCGGDADGRLVCLPSCGDTTPKVCPLCGSKVLADEGCDGTKEIRHISLWYDDIPPSSRKVTP